jgi:hypothetical protein
MTEKEDKIDYVSSHFSPFFLLLYFNKFFNPSPRTSSFNILQHMYVQYYVDTGAIQTPQKKAKLEVGT